jgi:hypothetical protein
LLCCETTASGDEDDAALVEEVGDEDDAADITSQVRVC